MNIFNVIKKDHDEAREVMEKILATHGGEHRLALYEKLKVIILSHAKSEERTFYEALKNADNHLSDEEFYLEKDHHDIERMFKEIDTLKAADPMWWEKFGEAREALLHHMEEEEKKIFKEAKQEIPSTTAQVLGEQMEELEAKEKIRLSKQAA